jgi:DNA-binding SARP family transcriptional activator
MGKHMTRLAIRLLGPFEVTLDGELITRFETLKVRALLAFLATEADSLHSREALAEMFWPDRPEGAARANLRHTLRSLRLAIRDYGTEPPFLLCSREVIGLNPDGDVWVDARAFAGSLSGLERVQLPHTQALERALDLYRGAFLEGLFLPDSALFEEWRVLKREQIQRKVLNLLSRLVTDYEYRGEYERALAHAWRQVDLEPWDEPARRQVMRLLACSGRRAEALGQYEACRTVLKDDLGVEPETETTRLAQRIRDGELEILTPTHARPPAFHPPRFLLEGADDTSPPLFVARERELTRLAALADQALEGTGSVAFVTGGLGQGKSALLDEFVRNAMKAHPEFLVARGDCSAYAGAGDPYLPFRDVLAMLTGDLEGLWLAGSIRYDHARRLWDALPLVMTSLLTWGPSLIGTLVDGDALLSRMAEAAHHANGWLEHLRALVARAQTGAMNQQQSFLFDQCARVLAAVAEQHPLALVLDDVHWADNASIGLLFHLGRRLAQAASCVLIVCAYRPEELGPAQGGDCHPLEKVLHEFKRTFGDVWVDLDLADQREGRRFVDAFLDAEPNRLGEGFRAALFHRTAGHPLFTVELLRLMQERGNLVRDEADGAWIQGRELDWQTLPARVEAAIEARIDHLEPRLRQIVSVASVEGEQFTAEVLAAVQGAAIDPVLQGLWRLERLHRLVREQGEVQVGSQRAAVYKFSHILIQEYLYQRFSQVQQRRLHGRVAAALEHLHRENPNQIAVRLAYHFLRAGDDGPAFHYSDLAAERAARRYAHEEAVTLYTQALELAARVAPDRATLARLHCRRGLAYETLGRFEHARADYETALQIGQAAGEHRVEWRALLDLARLWGSRDYAESRGFIDRALDLARGMGDPAVYAESLNWVANWHLNADDLSQAIEFHRQALSVVEQLGDHRETASTLERLALACQMRGELPASLEYYERAISRCRRMDDQISLAATLTGRGLAYCSGSFAAPTIVPPTESADAHLDLELDLEEALKIARETNSPSAESWALWAQSLFHTGAGQYGRALETVQGSLSIATIIGHREWMAGSRSILGHLYVELFAAEEAQLQLRQALALAERLHSQHWIHHATAALAGACCLLNDLVQAQAWLDALLSSETPMTSIHKRACWGRQAELALRQGRASLALDIAECLIASAPGMSPDTVIPYLGQLKAEALAALGQPEEAASLLQAAEQHAQVPGGRFLLWRLHASLGHVHGTMGRAAEAEAHFSTARLLVDELADTIRVEDLRDGFLQGSRRMLTTSP